MSENITESLQFIPLSELHPFKNHPFQVIENKELEELAQSIAQNGVITPAVVRARPEGGYELISGHRRKRACELAGLNALPAFIRDLDDDTATILMVDANQQRENLLPSEKAFAYLMKVEAIKRKAGRPKANSPQVASKFRSDDAVAESVGISGDTVRRYIRLTNLIPELLRMVDEKQIAMSPAVELSFLSKGMQKEVYDFTQMQQATPSLSQAVRLKKLAQKRQLTPAKLMDILLEQKANQKDTICFRADTFSEYFPKGTSHEQMKRRCDGCRRGTGRVIRPGHLRMALD